MGEGVEGVVEMAPHLISLRLSLIELHADEMCTHQPNE